MTPTKLLKQLEEQAESLNKDYFKALESLFIAFRDIPGITKERYDLLFEKAIEIRPICIKEGHRYGQMYTIERYFTKDPK